MREVRSDYFFKDMSKCPVREAFENIEYVWQALERKNNFLEKIKRDILGKVFDSTLEDDIFVGKGTVIKNSVIEGPAYIGNNCRIGPHAYIRPGTIIGDNSEIGRTEIKNSIIFSGVKSHHISYIGDSIIGSNVNIAVGVNILNLRHDKREVIIKINNKKFSTGMIKFGAIIGDNCKIGGNCSISPGTLIGPNCWTNPHIILKGFYPEINLLCLPKKFCN